MKRPLPRNEGCPREHRVTITIHQRD